MMDDFFGTTKKVKTKETKKPAKVKAVNLFDYLKDIAYLKKGNLQERDPGLKGFSSFMILRYLSLEESYVPFIMIIDKYQGVCTKEQMYRLLLNLIPRDNKFFKYPKKVDGAHSDKDIEIVKDYFECSRNDVLEFFQYGFLNERDISIIKEKFGGKM